MTPEFFQVQAKRLIRAYGEGNYPGPCLEALWSELKHISDTRFEKAITRILATYVSPKYPPGVDKIEKAISEIREEHIEIVKRQESTDAQKTFDIISAEEVSIGFGSILKKMG